MSRTISRRDTLIGSDYEILSFSQLPVPYQLAMAWYMAVDGEAWHDFVEIPEMVADHPDFMATFEALLPRFVESYGNVPFGVTTLSAQQVKDAYMGDAEISADFASFDDYHQWYVSHNDTPVYGQEGRWPAILGDDNSEAFQDGHHRLHSYLRAGHADVPLIFYPDRRHMQTLVEDVGLA